MSQVFASRRLRLAVSAIALMSMNVQPALAQKGKDALNVCATERAPLVKLETDYKELKRSKMGAAIGEGLKQGAMVMAKGVMSGGIPMGRGGGGFGGALGGVGGLMGAAASMSQPRGPAPGAGPAAGATMMFGQDLLTGASGLSVPGIGGGFSGGDNVKAYAALAVLVAIVATAEAYAQLKEQEAGGDLRKASFNIDQDAGRQLTVSREIANSGSALVDCRARQLGDINTRLAGASNDKDRKAIRKERTDLTSALKKDIDLTGGVVEQHAGMAKTFTQGRAMTDGVSEAEVLGNQAPAYATAANTTRLSMPAKGATPAQGGQAQAAAPAAPPALIAVRATVVRSAPVASAGVLMNFAAGREVKPKTAHADGGWWEIDVAGASGYVRAADLGPPGSAIQTAAAPAAKGRAGGRAGAKAAPPPPPAVQGPSNIRAYNQTVIAARDQGKGRLSSLMTDIQTSQRHESVLWAMLSRFGLG